MKHYRTQFTKTAEIKYGSHDTNGIHLSKSLPFTYRGSVIRYYAIESTYKFVTKEIISRK